MDDVEFLKVFLDRFGTKVKAIRESKNYTLDDLEFYTSIDSSDINKIELGQRNITLKSLLKIAKGLNVHPAELFNFTFDNSDRTHPGKT